ncbi:leucine Rich repeat-containing domain protein, partial [Opisthorchis viverrini]
SARLTNIPHDLPTNLIDLRVKQQLIPLISNKGLAQLTNLETLQIESSGVLRVTMDAFRSLTNLKYLNLQNNSLHLGINGLPKEALRSLPQLRTLNLAENPIDLVPDSFFVLSGGSQLQNLLLGPTKGVSMYIDPGAFMSLRKLRLLDLSFSKITSLPSNMQYTLDAMSELNELYLGGNPWHCDCKLRWLNRWFKKRAKSNIRLTKSVQNHHGQVLNFEPLCTTPDVLRDKPIFSPDLTDHSFQCTPKIITESQNVSVRAGETSTLSCEFYADPVSPVSWFKNGQQVQNGTRHSIIQRTTEETFVSDIQVTFDPSDDNAEWSCAIYSNDRPVGATFLLTVKP